MVKKRRESVAKLNEDIVREADQLLRQPRINGEKTTQALVQAYIKDTYGVEVSVKTISRIKNRESWQDVLGKPEEPLTPKIKKPDGPIIGFPSEYVAFHNEIALVKTTFALNHNEPLHWGWFESIEGIRPVASDGYILWDWLDLNSFAQEIVRWKVDREPFFSREATELPTLGVAEIMSRPIGGKLHKDISVGSNARRFVSDTNRVVYLDEKYVKLTEKFGAEFRELRDIEGFVYLVRPCYKKAPETLAIILAAIAVIEYEEENAEHSDRTTN